MDEMDIRALVRGWFALLRMVSGMAPAKLQRILFDECARMNPKDKTAA